MSLAVGEGRETGEVKEMTASDVELRAIAERVRAGWSRGELVREGYDPGVVDQVLEARDRARARARKAPREEAMRSIDRGLSMDPAREREAYRRAKRKRGPVVEETESPHEFQTMGSLLRHEGAPSYSSYVRNRVRSDHPKWAHYEMMSVEDANWREWPPATSYVFRILPGTTFEELTPAQQQDIVKGGSRG